MGLLKRFFGAYDPGEDDFDEFADPAEVKPSKKKGDKESMVPWGPLVPSGADLIIEVKRTGQKNPDRWGIAEYRKQLFVELGSQSTTDLDAVIASRVKAGDAAYRLIMINPENGKLADYAPEELETAFVKAYNAAMLAAKEKIEAEATKRREAAKKAAAAPTGGNLTEDILRMASKMTDAQKENFLNRMGNCFTPQEVMQIMLAAPNEGTGASEEPPPMGDPFASDPPNPPPAS